MSFLFMRLLLHLRKFKPVESAVLILSVSVLIGFSFPLAGHAENGFVYDDHGKRDPFWPLVGENGAIRTYDANLMLTDLVLEGIMAGVSGQNLAIINGNIVRESEKVGNFKVISISESSVELQKDDKLFELKLKKED